MTEDTVTASGNPATGLKAPTHLWIVGVLALLWNAFGALDYTMSRMRDEAYFRKMMPDTDPAAILAYIDAMPAWASAGWALGVWGGLIGALLLLARSRHAVTLFVLSLLGVVLAFGYQLFVATDRPAAMDSPVMPLVVSVIAVALLAYARAMRAKGVLR